MSKKATKRHAGFGAIAATSLIFAGLPNSQPLRSKEAPPVARMYLAPMCLIADEPRLVKSGRAAASVVSVFFTALLDKLVGKLAGAFRDAGKKHSTVVAANQDFYLYVRDESLSLSLNPSLACLTIVVGTFEPRTNCTTPYTPPVTWSGTIVNIDAYNQFLREPSTLRLSALDVLDTAKAQGLITVTNITNRPAEQDNVSMKLLRGGICLKGEPYSAFEAQFVLSEDETAFRYQAAFLEVNRVFSGSKRSKRDAVAALLVQAPTKDGNGETLAVSTIQLGQIKPGTTLDANKRPKSGWIPVPPPSKAVRQRFNDLVKGARETSSVVSMLTTEGNALKAKIASIKQANPNAPELSALQQQLNDLETRIKAAEQKHSDAIAGVPRRYMPVNVVASFTETRNENATLLFIADLLDKNKDKIVAKAGGAIIPELREEKEVASEKTAMDFANSLSDARISYLDTLAALTAKQAELDGLSSGASASARDIWELQVSSLEEKLAKSKRKLNVLLARAGEAAIP